MWMTIIGFLGGPVIKGLIDAYQAKLKAGNVSERIAADSAAGEMAVQSVEIREQHATRRAEIGHPFEPEKLFAYSLWFYFTKVYIYDAALGLGTTDAVKGEVAVWGGLVITFYFAKRGFENVARILKR
jgi:hypothetical protein